GPLGRIDGGWQQRRGHALSCQGEPALGPESTLRGFSGEPGPDSQADIEPGLIKNGSSRRDLAIRSGYNAAGDRRGPDSAPGECELRRDPPEGTKLLLAPHGQLARRLQSGEVT